VAVVGGATAGAEAASILAARGVLCAVFEQNCRPFGKIEDGLPRWHDKLRRKEYDTINAKLDHPLVHFVPSTKVGTDVDLVDLTDRWGFSAVILANGAWRDRQFPVAGADEFVSRGLVYQNSFIYWFNHFMESGYDGPVYDVPDGAVVVGGGLASIDVVKALQVEGVRRALRNLGIEVDALAIEHAGIPATLAGRGLSWEDLGLRGAALYYRRRIEDMPLADEPEDGDPSRLAKVEATRRKILEKAMQKYCFQVFPLQVPVAILSDAGRVSGVRFQATRVERRSAVPIPGAFCDVPTSMVVSSIGSVPEPLRGVPLDGQLYRFTDLAHGRLEGYDAVFGTGNVVTGKGNIKASRKHSIEITTYVAESFLGLRDGDRSGEEALLSATAVHARETADRVAQWVDGRPPLSRGAVKELLVRIRSRQEDVGYTHDYRQWIADVSPPDFC
jgi:NADPH-dependent glutamate synthase beta subunit-like oxidoreductase